jgi:hypothetical protein
VKISSFARLSMLGVVSGPEKWRSCTGTPPPRPGRDDVLREIKVSIFPLTGIVPHQTIIMSVNPLNHELNKNTKLVIFIYKSIDIHCLAENDIRESLSGYREEDQV